MENIRIGQKVRFVPAGFISEAGAAMFKIGKLPTSVTGTVVGIHPGHHWYRTRYEVNGVILHECFKFTD